MPLITGADETIATPGFAGFIPTLAYQYGLTYGNATRQILSTDHSLKKGIFQLELARQKHLQNKFKSENNEASGKGADVSIQKTKHSAKYSTGDDRLAFPPVSGYTGYIPRSQEHFGRPYLETTAASLTHFQSMLKSKNELPAKIEAIKSHYSDAKAKSSSVATPPPIVVHPSNAFSNYEVSPYKLPSKDPKKTFICGYTGFVPRLQNYFGEPYSENVRFAIDEFTTPKPPNSPYKNMNESPRVARVEKFKKIQTTPIPGFTGYIPGSRTCYSTTFGKTADISYENFNHRDEKGRITQALTYQFPVKDLSKTRPIPGYKGYIPNYKYSADKSYGISSRECINNFRKMHAIYTA